MNGKYITYYCTAYCAAPDDYSVIQDFTRSPVDIFNSGRRFTSAWKNPQVEKTTVTISGRQFFIKRYHGLGHIHQIKNVFRHSKAWKAWQNGRKFIQTGIATPRPILCLEQRYFRLLGEAYLVCEHLPDAVNLLDIWSGLDQPQRANYLNLAGKVIGHMHRMHFLHGDLNWRNILIQEMANHKQLYLVDLDGSHHTKWLNRDKAKSDLKHFYRDLDRNDATAAEIESFSESWQKAFTGEIA